MSFTAPQPPPPGHWGKLSYNGTDINFAFAPEKISQQLGQQQQVLGHSPNPNTSTTEGGTTTDTQVTAEQPTLPSPKLSFNVYLRKKKSDPAAKVRDDAYTIQNWGVKFIGGDTDHPAANDSPTVLFSWGQGFSSIKVKVTTANIDFLSFDDNGYPILAMVTLALTMAPNFHWYPATNPTSGGTAPIGAHLVLDGDSLPSVAYHTYGKASYWRLLANVNGIDDPLRIRPGTMLRLPVRAELTPVEPD